MSIPLLKLLRYSSRLEEIYTHNVLGRSRLLSLLKSIEPKRGGGDFELADWSPTRKPRFYSKILGK